MTTAYAALLPLRQVEEQRAEATLATALHEVDDLEKVLRGLSDARAAWLAGELGGVAETLTGLETAERSAERRLIDAERRMVTARQALLECQRQRKVVEELHQNALAAAARPGARRAPRGRREAGKPAGTA